jgi:hypothetical protein
MPKKKALPFRRRASDVGGDASKRTPIPRAAWGFFAIWILISAYLLWRARVPAGHPEYFAIWANTLATLAYTGLTLLLVFLTWRLYTIATEATTQVERAHRASHSPLLMAKVSAVVATGTGRSLRLDIANVGDGTAYSIRTQTYLKPGYGEPNDHAEHTVALPKGQTITVLLDVTWLIRVFRVLLHELIQDSLPTGVVYPPREDNYDTLSTFDEDLRDLCSFTNSDFIIEVAYTDLYGTDTQTTVIIPRGELALQRVARVDRAETNVSPRTSHQIETSFEPGEEIGDEYHIDLRHPGYWPSSVREVRVLSQPDHPESRGNPS